MGRLRMRPFDEARDDRELETVHGRAGDLPVISSEELFGGASEIGIRHEGGLYRLKITRQGKLILNK